MESVIIHGPPGSGKTRNAGILMKKFKLKKVVDEWTRGTPIKASGYLYLTTEKFLPQLKDYYGVKLINIDEAMRGLKGK